MLVSPPLARRAGAVLTALVGTINILSALYPAIPGRMEILQDMLPLHIIRASQTATVLVGFCLILLADGLRKRRRRALRIVIALLAAASVLNLAKGLDYEEATAGILLAVGLVTHRRAFTVAGARPAPRRVLGQIALFAAVYYAYLIAGFVALRHVIAPTATLSAITLEPFRLIAGNPNFAYLTADARWFERSIAFFGCLAILYAGLQALRPFIPLDAPSPDDLQHVRQVVQRWGDDTLSYFAFQRGRRYFFDDDRAAFLSYRLWRAVAIVGGPPVGPPDRIEGLLARFIDFCDANGLEPCFLGIPGNDVAVYANLGLRTVKIGEEALIDLPSFDSGALKRKVRRAARHCEDAGLQVEVYRRDALPSQLSVQMHQIHEAWIRERGGNERGFSMTLGRLPGAQDPDCEVVVARQEDSQVVGFLCLVPAYGGNAWSLDAMRRRDDCPNGLMEFLIIRAAEHYRDAGYGTLSLNFAALSNCQNDIDSRALDATRRFLYDHLSSVYQLRSLEQFCSKFQPHWHSRYLAYRDVLQLPRVALAVAQAEDPIKFPTPGTLFRRF